MQLQTITGQPFPRPLGLLAELTHRCPLGCPYCSNPTALESRGDEIDTANLMDAIKTVYCSRN
jgi:MoaA/NifB/PqqE/SkfB family radical SAM enzyme